MQSGRPLCGGRIGWNSYLENQPAFGAFNTLYDAAFGTNALAEVEAAVNLPGFQERDEAGETFHIQLTEAHAVALYKWKALRSYIKHAFPPELQKPKIESAGYDHYTQAANLNWAETQLLLVAGQHFLDNNTAELTAGGMPATFAGEYATASGDFLGVYDKFTDAEQDAKEATDVKISANNAIYKKLMMMFEDAQIIFDREPSKRERFVFSQVYAMITNVGGGTTIPTDTVLIEGKVTDIVTGTAVANASVNTTPDGSAETFSTVTGADGSFSLTVNGLPPSSTGTLNVNAEAIDYMPSTLPLDYATGKAYKLEFQLSEFLPPEPPVEP
jgi:hypothetical protein